MNKVLFSVLLSTLLLNSSSNAGILSLFELTKRSVEVLIKISKDTSNLNSKEVSGIKIRESKKNDFSKLEIDPKKEEIYSGDPKVTVLQNDNIHTFLATRIYTEYTSCGLPGIHSLYYSNNERSKSENTRKDFLFIVTSVLMDFYNSSWDVDKVEKGTKKEFIQTISDLEETSRYVKASHIGNNSIELGIAGEDTECKLEVSYDDVVKGEALSGISYDSYSCD
ncbi:hypothetical protein N9N67_00390 [Bacteriovoracaceae bacterium]|nr:hypothetical protein [Bacteriovoracaceae bacterium]